MNPKKPPRCWHFYGTEGWCVKCGLPKKDSVRINQAARVLDRMSGK